MMILPDNPKFMQSILALWQENKSRELIYIGLMKSEFLGRFSTHCRKGHMSTLIFLKEVKWMIEHARSYAEGLPTRERLVADEASARAERQIAAVRDSSSFVSLLENTEKQALTVAESALFFIDDDDDEDNDTRRILLDQVDMLRRLFNELSIQKSRILHDERALSVVAL